MSMLSLNGQVLNCFDTPESVDKKTGEVRPAKNRVQVMCENTLQNGQKRMDMVNLSVDNILLYQKNLGKLVRVPVGVFASGNEVLFYALKGNEPEFVA